MHDARLAEPRPDKLLESRAQMRLDQARQKLAQRAADEQARAESARQAAEKR